MADAAVAGVPIAPAGALPSLRVALCTRNCSLRVAVARLARERGVTRARLVPAGKAAVTPQAFYTRLARALSGFLVTRRRPFDSSFKLALARLASLGRSVPAVQTGVASRACRVWSAPTVSGHRVASRARHRPGNAAVTRRANPR